MSDHDTHLALVERADEKARWAAVLGKPAIHPTFAQLLKPFAPPKSAVHNLAGDFESRIDGIPCRIEVTHFVHQPPDRSCADSDVDFYGYQEIEFDVLDVRGRPAPWLVNKLTEADESRINAEICQFKGV